MKKIVVCVGHLTPALALIDRLQKVKDLEILFFGRKYTAEGSQSLSAEYQIITSQKIRFFPITTGRLQRKFTRFTIPSLLKLPFGFIQSFIYLILHRPNLIISFGGYLSVPVVFSGWLLGISSISHEQTVKPGLATRINSLFVQKIFLSWAKSAKFLSEEKCQVVGNLFRESIFSSRTASKDLSSFLRKSKNLILVAGGNQGSHFLNKFVFANLDLFNKFFLIHQVGTVNYHGDFDMAKTLKRNNYFAVDYLGPQDFGAVLAKAKIVISRSGANTVWELALCKKPSILIPLPISAGGEQLENAQILSGAHFAKIISQADLSPTHLKKAIDEILENYSDYQSSADKFQKTLPKDATAKLVRYILSSI